MSPRLMGLPRQLAQFSARPFQQASPLAFLLPQSQQTRDASILASLSDNPTAYHKRIRRGRGPASGKGKTSGRGHKGQGQHGKVPAGFNGGQTKDIIVHGERGGVNIFSVDMATVNLDRLQYWIDQGRINPKLPITLKELYKSGCISRPIDGLKILADGAEALKQPIHVVASRVSASAIAAIEGAGGSVTTRYYTRPSIRRILDGETHSFLSAAWAQASGSKQLYRLAKIPPAVGWMKWSTVVNRYEKKYRLPDPTKRKDIEYYRDPAHRGYLSHLLKPLEGPSLFFRSSEERKSAAGVKKEKVLPENRLW
ncbi:Ribosomal protein L15 bacterial-type [Penicillium cf. griseofulvum]|uniref:Ribosomal protein L15 bacterial-type n=1 Tax=Penicillium cf. griseofulvum TaxID=2972120 RepID=A0A9W9J1C7_9EURO|nr:Ribosomal protein L15 bacterial-type [Penicillium cf. griseofulvum]KAJ5434575.1 Ribosomal protein L15 bacterial-type [Penicillium cf. griseofulvum]KAJ5452404.1 Ribosomal protein L15 bacterial-type [Penicillium cf. griseofulvum]